MGTALFLAAPRSRVPRVLRVLGGGAAAEPFFGVDRAGG